ncbi:MAG: sigma-70 family RNA polymerase sigma factor, partial [Chloroflexota bacterium]
MVQTTLQKDQVRMQLVEKANQQGYITYDNILATIPDVEQDVALLDDIMDELLEAGIEIVPGGSKPNQSKADNTLLDSVGDDVEDMENDDDEGEEDIFAATRQTFKNLHELTEDAGYQAALDTDDVVGLYLKEAGRVPLLTASEEVALAKRMEAAVWAREKMKEVEESGEELRWSEEQSLREVIIDGDRAQEHLIRANARLVISVAKKYIGRGVPFLDLIQEGNIGLIRATNKFEYQRGHKFSTYATWWIRQAVSRAVADQ